MKRTLTEIMGVFEEIAPSTASEAWDNSGLQVGRLSQEINKILVSLDPTLKAANMASERKAQLLITHHPLIFKPLSCINPDCYPGDIIFYAITKGLSIVSLHTNLDAVRNGINGLLADFFELRDTEILQEKEDLGADKVGLGIIGNLSKPLRLSEVIRDVKNTLGQKIIKVIGSKNIKIRRVAIVGGSGGGLIPLAHEKNADLLITGDVGHHAAIEAQALGLALIDGGHFNTEKLAMSLFADRLQEKFMDLGWDIPVEFYKGETCPFRYE